MTQRNSHRPGATHKRQRTYSIRWHLLVLIVGSLAPVIVFAISLVHQLSQKERFTAERRLLEVARGVSAIIDREITSTFRTLHALSESRSLDRGDIRAFYSEIRRVTKTQPTWLTVILLTPDGRQLMNSARTFGTAADKVNEPESLRRLVQTGQPTVGNVALGKRGKQWAFALRVPVFRSGKLRYVLNAVITPDVLIQMAASHGPSEGEWTRSVVDSRGHIVVRTRNPKQFIGRRATEYYLQQIRRGEEGIFASTTLDGVPVRTAFHRLGTTSWTTSVSVPVTVLEAPARRAMMMVIGMGAALLLLSSAGAYYVSRQISSAITSAAVAADSLVSGELTAIEVAGIREMAVLREALVHSSELLERHERERNIHLKQVELARDEAETANRLKDYFLATLSHEIRSPLTAILGLASLMRMTKLDAVATGEALATIERNAQLLSRLVGDLLDMSRINAGKLFLQLEPVNLAAIVSSVYKSVQTDARTKNIRLELNINSTGLVSGDPDRLQQIIWNLVTNAIKFTPEGGTVEVRLGQTETEAVLEIQDTGIGIEPELLPHIFERFRQGDGSNTRKFGGLGLGLAIVRDLVELHGGSVEAQSAGKGAGTIFILKLALIEPAYHTESANRAESGGENGTG